MGSGQTRFRRGRHLRELERFEHPNRFIFCGDMSLGTQGVEFLYYFHYYLENDAAECEHEAEPVRYGS